MEDCLKQTVIDDIMQDEDILFNWAITADIGDESLSHELLSCCQFMAHDSRIFCCRSLDGALQTMQGSLNKRWLKEKTKEKASCKWT
jgi:hypothetical protein